MIFALLPMIIFMAVFLLLVGGFIFLIIKMVVKTKNSYWRGKVVDKFSNVAEDTDGNDRNFLTLVVKTDEGQTRKIAVAKEMYDSCKVGDTLEKPKGKLNPVKV
jgi:hypothetical protein